VEFSNAVEFDEYGCVSVECIAGDPLHQHSRYWPPGADIVAAGAAAHATVDDKLQVVLRGTEDEEFKFAMLLLLSEALDKRTTQPSP
jgi:hypothetical protein